VPFNVSSEAPDRSDGSRSPLQVVSRAGAIEIEQPAVRLYACRCACWCDADQLHTTTSYARHLVLPRTKESPWTWEETFPQGPSVGGNGVFLCTAFT
jgi:hypothetical protein